MRVTRIAPLVTLAALFSLSTAAQAQRFTGLNFKGQATFPAQSVTVDGTLVGGLSGLTFDAANNRYYSIADDRGALGNTRFYTLNLNIDNTPFNNADVSFTNVTTLTDGAGQNFALNTTDFEGIAFRGNSLFISDEGNGTPVPGPITPSVREFNLTTGQQIRQMVAPGKFAPTATTGIYHNLAFESLTLTDGGASLLTGTENGLRQDTGNAANPSLAAQSARLAKIDIATGNYGAEFVYTTDPIAFVPQGGNFGVTGLVEILSLGGDDFLSIERSFTVGSPGTGYSIKLYQFSLTGATDVSGQNTLVPGFTPIQKELLFDLGALGIPLDNIEGVTLGPNLPGGLRTIVLVSDDNFSTANGNGPGSPGQFTQFIVLSEATAPEPATFGLLAIGLGGIALVARRRK